MCILVARKSPHMLSWTVQIVFDRELAERYAWTEVIEPYRDSRQSTGVSLRRAS